MTVPNRNDFDLYTGDKLTGTQWNNSRDQIVAYLTDGNYDFTINSLTGNVTGDVRKTFATLTAGENLTAGDVVRIASGQVYKADNTTEAGITSVVGVCKTTVSSGGTVTIDYGFYDAFSSLTVGTTYYVGVGGAITSTKPSGSDKYLFEIGQAVSATRINFSFNNKSSNLEVQNATPSLTLRDIWGGSGEAQEIKFETPDGQYAKIRGLTTGSAVGKISLYTDSGSGSTERLTVDSSTEIKTQHIKTNSGGIFTWTGINMSAGQYCTIMTAGGHIAGELQVRGRIVSSAADYVARYGVACDSWSPYTSISLLGGSIAASSLDVYWNSDDLRVGVDSAASSSPRSFYITLHYTGTPTSFISSPVVIG